MFRIFSIVVLLAMFCLGMYTQGLARSGEIPVQKDDINFEVIRSHPGLGLYIGTYDVDSDGFNDILFGNTFIGPILNLFIMYGLPGGEYELPVMQETNMRTITLGYLDNDAYLDIVISCEDFLYIYINNGDRTYTIDTIYQGAAGYADVALGYFNEDAHVDILGSLNRIYLGDGNGSFPETKAFPYYCLTAYVADFNNDGIDDVVGLDSYGNGRIYLNDGDCNFSYVSSFSLGGATLATCMAEPLADFNRDGNTDFAFITPDYSGHSYIRVGYGDGAGDLMGIDTLVASGTAHSLVIVDINQDHILDLIASDATNSLLVIFTGIDTGGFSDSILIENPGIPVIPHALGVGDLDRDGNPDLLTIGMSRDSVRLFINQLPDKPVIDQEMITTGYSNITLDIINPGSYKISRNYRTVAGSEYWRRDADVDNSLDEQAVDYNLQYGEYKLVFKTKYNAEPDATFSADIKIGNQKAVFFKDYETPPLTRGEGGRLESDSIIFYYAVEQVSSIQPANGGQAIEQPTFDWNVLIGEPSGAESYNFQLDRYYDFRSPIHDVYDLETPQFTPDNPLGVDSVFYWRFRTLDGLEWSEYSRTFAVNIVPYICGDINEDTAVDIFDIVFLIAYLYLDGPSPANLFAADVNKDGDINIFDVTGLIGYLYLGGAEPNCP